MAPGPIWLRHWELETNLRTKLTDAEMVKVTKFFEHAHDATFWETRERQQRKYDPSLRKRQQAGQGEDKVQRGDPDNITERSVISLADR